MESVALTILKLAKARFAAEGRERRGGAEICLASSSLSGETIRDGELYHGFGTAESRMLRANRSYLIP